MRHLLLACCFVILSANLPAQEPGPLRKIGFGSCANQNKPQPVWDAVNNLKPELFLFLGDNIYADTEKLEVFQDKYARLASIAGFKQLMNSTKVMATWDDHDMGKNDAGVEYAKKKESQVLFMNFWKIPADAPMRKQEGVYSSAIFGPTGQRVQVILLDTRYFRSKLVKKTPPTKGSGTTYIGNDDASATILGEAQWKWLEAELQKPAEVRLIGSSIQMVAEDHGWEKWMNFPKERERFLELVKKYKAEGIIILSGDRHLAEISMMKPDIGYPLYDVTSSGLTEADKTFRAFEVNQHRVGTMNFGNNFGMILIDWYPSDPIIRMQIRDEEGEVTLQQKIPLSLLKVGGAVAKRGKSLPEVKPITPGAIPPSEAKNKLGEEVVLEFIVRATGGSKTRTYLNSDEDFRSSNNFTVVLEKDALKAHSKGEVDDPKEFYKGKRVKVTGKVETYQSTLQIKVIESKYIEVLEVK